MFKFPSPRPALAQPMAAIHDPRWIWNGRDWTAYCCGSTRSGSDHEYHIKPKMDREIPYTLLLAAPVSRAGDRGYTVAMGQI